MATSVGLQSAAHPLPSILSFQEMIPQDFRTRAYRTEVLRERVRERKGLLPLLLGSSHLVPGGLEDEFQSSQRVRSVKPSKFPGQLQLLTVRAGGIAHWKERTGVSTHDSAAPDVYPSSPKLLQLFLPPGTR